MDITIAICTWNRADLLSRALRSFEYLVVPSDCEWEILVIDNNSADNTPRVVEQFSATLPVRYFFEPQQGLSHARNLACREARGELLVFTDDDVLADRNWLKDYAAAADKFSDAAFFGGTIKLRFAARPPQWLANNLELFATAYASRCLDPGVCRITRREDVPFGANMAFRRRVFAEELFATNLGRTGASLLGGEETEFMARLLARGEEGIWVGSARVEHLIPKQRMTKSYIHDFFLWQGRAEVRLGRFVANANSVRRLKKKHMRAQRALRFHILKNASWADLSIRSAFFEGILAELVAQGLKE